ncbi:helix-turn-helix transcriptional regulator [Arthrobacter sp. Cr_A7]|uniref:helix-turn-helix transcriptional regulator n=1 Tax=Arthrobacter sp. Cr_A7 TaxID=3031017 RepID=UPI0023DACF7E|nr:helix-turn-helix transcriptional regulator [Arthrobacter sp. Cr_A7]MDF2051394.1 helix-turn-helix transcriptional regulator [Arthrobacter sp. Cr_A7]
MPELDQLLTSGREAFARRDWPAAANNLAAAARQAPLSTRDLEALASSAWWLGNVPGALAGAEELYRRLNDAGDRPGAAMTAINLSLRWGTRGDLALASGWLNRARRNLDGLEGIPAYGYLLYVEASMSLDFDGDAAPVAGASAALVELWRTHRDPALLCFARILSGLALVRSGQTAAGFSDIDEAMLPVLAGEVPAEWSGDIYCTVTHLCHALGDYARMRAWTQALEHWTSGLSRTFVYARVTRVHELQLLSTEGSWEDVIREIGPLSEELAAAHGWMAGAGFYELGDILRLRGDSSGAARAFSRVRGTGLDPQPGEALLLHAAGHHGQALEQLSRSLGEGNPLDRARLLLPATEIALACRQPDLAAAYCGELEQIAERFASPGFLAWASHARAHLLLSSGMPAEAAAALESAARIYRSQRARYSIAQVHELFAGCRTSMHQQAAAEADMATALAIYRQLGALPDVRRLEPGLPGGLTAREAEVLALVSRGASNRDVAGALVLSEKTVGRHLANIFQKIGVTSRTGAASWAREHRLL